MNTLYRYTGRDFLVGVPARDLTEQDFTDFATQWSEMGITEATINGCGLYEKVDSETTIYYGGETEAPTVNLDLKPKQPKKNKAAKEGE